MSDLIYRRAGIGDVDAMANIRAQVWGTEAFWEERISGYLRGDYHPQHALKPRVVYLALDDESSKGFIAGHLTRRYGCDGELEWLNVVPESRGTGVSAELLRKLAAWFAAQHASRICVDVDPMNEHARTFYTRHGASRLNDHWLVWDNIAVIAAGRSAD